MGCFPHLSLLVRLLHSELVLAIYSSVGLPKKKYLGIYFSSRKMVSI